MEMQTVLIIFIAVFSLAIGFFLGLFLISVDAPFLKKLFQKDTTDEADETADTDKSEPAVIIEEKAPSVIKPSQYSEQVLIVWREEGKAPVYEVDGI